jgi:hypothetical protein
MSPVEASGQGLACELAEGFDSIKCAELEGEGFEIAGTLSADAVTGVLSVDFSAEGEASWSSNEGGGAEGATKVFDGGGVEVDDEDWFGRSGGAGDSVATFGFEFCASGGCLAGVPRRVVKPTVRLTTANKMATARAGS